MEQINEVLQENVRKVGEILSADVSIGKGITIGETISIIPVSTVTCGTMCGLCERKYKRKEKSQTLGGGTDGGGIGVKVKPLGFLVIEKGVTRYISCEQAKNESNMQSVLSAVIEKVTGIKI